MNEFRFFAARASVLDLTIGIIIGAGLTAVVKSLVDDLINPVVGLVLGGKGNLTDMFVNLADERKPISLAHAKEIGVPVFAYGSFISACINFLIIAGLLFLLLKQVNRLKEGHGDKETGGGGTASDGTVRGGAPGRDT